MLPSRTSVFDFFPRRIFASDSSPFLTLGKLENLYFRDIFPYFRIWKDITNFLF